MRRAVPVALLLAMTGCSFDLSRSDVVTDLAAARERAAEIAAPDAPGDASRDRTGAERAVDARAPDTSALDLRPDIRGDVQRDLGCVEDTPCKADAGNGVCHAGTCCTGCWHASAGCLPGTTTAACGTHGAKCLSCLDGQKCTDGACH